MENIWKTLKEESATAPSRRQIDVSGQHAVPIIPLQNDASSRHNHISEWTPPPPHFFFFQKFLKSWMALGVSLNIFKCCQRMIDFQLVFLTLNNIKRIFLYQDLSTPLASKSYSTWSRVIHPFRSLLFSFLFLFCFVFFAIIIVCFYVGGSTSTRSISILFSLLFNKDRFVENARDYSQPINICKKNMLLVENNIYATLPPLYIC